MTLQIVVKVHLLNPEPSRGALRSRRARSSQSRASFRALPAAIWEDRAMELSDYQRLSRRTAEYPRDAWLAYPALGLAGEAGEVAEHAKKAIRDDRGQVSDERRSAIAAELGDVLWYVAQITTELGLDLDQIAAANLQKLLSRQQRGVLSGSGDER
jgi:NTP pyrophosphatase (non-canonical NTP hydrolase)